VGAQIHRGTRLRADHQPDGLGAGIEGNVVQGTSRALSEEVAFDPTRVTSTDWLTYPILDITERPRRSTSC